MGEDDKTMKMQMQTAALQVPTVPEMDGLPVRRMHHGVTREPRSSPTSSQSATPTSGVLMGAFWRDYAKTRQDSEKMRQDFESKQNGLDISSASLDSIYRALTESSSGASEG